ncbi:Ku protein [Aureimonas mangrovi]|uniref:non-homologous end joining protein Ku n=1 Tax=Aureimonas mangrovi TaxID=2758041 RepID=UPI00163D400A|nr:Ku protein [Aureimonas mangrovi]
MAPRPVWKGQIRLSLVSIPVEMFSATKSGATISFNQIHRPSGKRIHYEKVAAGVGPVDKDDIVKGYEVSKGEYVLLTDEEIEDVKLETKKTLELVQFVDMDEIPPLYFDRPYYVVPSDDLAEDAFRVVRDALRQSRKAGLGQLAMRGKEYLVALRPCGKGLLLETLHYQDEIQKSETIFSEISNSKTDGDLLEVATALIERKSAPFDAGEYKNRYTAALKELIAEKRRTKGKSKVAPHEDDDDDATPKGSNVVDLMASLKKSLEQGGKGGGSKPAAKPAPKKTARKPAAKSGGRASTASRRKSA